MRVFLGAVLVLTLGGPVMGQKVADTGWGDRMIVVVPMVGKGTFDDPVRPGLPLEALGSQEGVGYRYELSDDKKSAIVYLTTGRVGRLKELPAKAQGLGFGLQMIDHEKLDKAGVEVELRKLRKELTVERLVGLPMLDAASLAAGGAK